MDIEQNILRIERELAELKAVHAARKLPRFYVVPGLRLGTTINYSVLDREHAQRMVARFYTHDNLLLAITAKRDAEKYAEYLNKGE